jgi:EmrB/QacA subfamily drug resistance transporter
MKKFERKADARLYLSIVATGLLSFTGVVIETSMNVIFPTLIQEFSISTSLVQWVTTGYLLVLSIVIPASSYLKQRFPLKKLFLSANLLFLAGVLFGALAPNFTILLLGRLLQGAGTGIALPLMFNIVLEQAPLNRIGFMMGAAMLVCALAPAIGPSFGGYVVTVWGWHMIFFSLLPLIFFSLISGLYAIRQSSPYGPREFDLPGMILLACAFTTFLLACSEASSIMNNAFPFVIFLVLALFFLIAFYRHEEACLKKGKVPLLSLRPLCTPAFSLSVLCLFLITFICLSIGFLLPSFAQIVLGESAFASGCILLPGCLIGAVISPISGRIYDSIGAKSPLLLGGVFFFICLAIYQFVMQSATILTMTLAYIVFTLGQSLSIGNTLTYGISALQKSLRADGNAIANTIQQLSGAIGTAVSAAIIAMYQYDAADFLTATATGTRIVFALLFVMAIIHNLCIRRALQYQKQ